MKCVLMLMYSGGILCMWFCQRLDAASIFFWCEGWAVWRDTREILKISERGKTSTARY